MRTIDQWIDEGKGLFLNREIVMFTFYGKGIYWGRFVSVGVRHPLFKNIRMVGECVTFPASAPYHYSDIFMDGVPQGGRSGQTYGDPLVRVTSGCLCRLATSRRSDYYAK
jgi:hypothetical protein